MAAEIAFLSGFTAFCDDQVVKEGLKISARVLRFSLNSWNFTARVVRLKQASYNTLRIVHNQFTTGISPYFWIIKMISKEILKQHMWKWTSNVQLDCKHREEGKRWFCTSFLCQELYYFILNTFRSVYKAPTAFKIT